MATVTAFTPAAAAVPERASLTLVGLGLALVACSARAPASYRLSTPTNIPVAGSFAANGHKRPQRTTSVC
jgi:hypothetical protein